MSGLEENLYRKGPLLDAQTAHYLMHHSNIEISADLFPNSLKGTSLTNANYDLHKIGIQKCLSTNYSKPNIEKKVMFKWEPSKMLPALLSESIIKYCWQEKYAILEGVYHEALSEQKKKNPNMPNEGLTYESLIMLLAKYPCIEMAKQRVLFHYLDNEKKGYVSNINFISGLLAASPEAIHEFPYNEELYINKIHSKIPPITIIRLQTIFQTANLNKDGYLTEPELTRLLNIILSVIIDYLKTKKYLLNNQESFNLPVGPILHKAIQYIHTHNIKTDKPIEKNKSVIDDTIKPATKRLGELFMDTIKPYVFANNNNPSKNKESPNIQEDSSKYESIKFSTKENNSVISDVKPSEKVISKKPSVLPEKNIIHNQLNNNTNNTSRVSWMTNLDSNVLSPSVVIRSNSHNNEQKFSLTNESTKSSSEYRINKPYSFFNKKLTSSSVTDLSQTTSDEENQVLEIENILKIPIKYLYIIKKQNWLSTIAKQIIKIYNVNPNKNILCFFGFLKAVKYRDILGLELLFRTKYDFSTIVSNTQLMIDPLTIDNDEFSKYKLETVDSLWEFKNQNVSLSQPLCKTNSNTDKAFSSQPFTNKFSCLVEKSKNTEKRISFNIPTMTVTDDNIESSVIDHSIKIEELQLARRVIAAITTVKITGWFSKNNSNILSNKSCRNSIIKLLPAPMLISLCDSAVKYVKQSKIQIINRQTYIAADALIPSGINNIADLMLHPRLETILRGSEHDDDSNPSHNPAIVILGGIKPYIAVEDCVDLSVLLLACKVLYPTRFIFLRGAYDDFFTSVSFGFEAVCCERYGNELGRELCRRIFDVMEYLPIAVSIQIPCPKISASEQSEFSVPPQDKQTKSLEVEWTGLYLDDDLSLDEQKNVINKFIDDNYRKILCIGGDAVNIENLTAYEDLITTLNNDSEPVSSLLMDFQDFNNTPNSVRKIMFELIWSWPNMHVFNKYVQSELSLDPIFSSKDLNNPRFTTKHRMLMLQYLKHDILIRPTSIDGCYEQQYLCYDI